MMDARGLGSGKCDGDLGLGLGGTRSPVGELLCFDRVAEDCRFWYTVVGVVTASVRTLDPALPFHTLTTMEALVRASVGRHRLLLALLGAFASIACSVPGRRAVRVDPVVALRAD